MNYNPLPEELFLVRHGESEFNAANRRAKNGDWNDFTGEWIERHASKWRLTDKGKQQAVQAGAYLIEEYGADYFNESDGYYVSEYLRARETAGLMGLPNAQWKIEAYLRERDWGQYDSAKYLLEADNLKVKTQMDIYYGSPPSGESMATLCLRADRILSTLARERSNAKAILVCHGEMMWAFRLRLEKFGESGFRMLDNSFAKADHIHNCQILHYSRRKDGILYNQYQAMKSVCPWDFSLSANEWKQFVRKKYSNEELLADVESWPQIIKA